MELRVEIARGLLREAGNALELLLRGLEKVLDGTEVPDDRATPHRPTPGRPSKIVSIERVPRFRRW